jgi:hypothetical protein
VFTAHGLGETTQVGRCGHNLDALLGIPGQHQGQAGGNESETQCHEPKTKKGRTARPFYGFSQWLTQILFGIRQWTFFSESDIAPTRQSIATLASP